MRRIILLFPALLLAFTTFSQKKLDGGSLHSIILCDGDSVTTTGDNLFGQLGNATNIDLNVFTKINLSSIWQVAAGYHHTLALRSDSTVWAWGQNSNGQLGDGTNNNSNVPVQVAGLDSIIAIEGGFYHSMALSADGYVYTWGQNNVGQLGNGGSLDSNVPIKINFPNDIIAISSVGYHCMALRKDSTVWVWGQGTHGQIGDNNNNNQNTPTQVLNLTDVIAIAASGYHCLAIKDDSTVWGWGYNLEGQLGLGNKTNFNLPQQMQNISGVVEIAAGCHHSLMRKSNGTVWAVGRDTIYGQLGDGNTTNATSVVPVAGVSSAKRIAAGCWHSMAVLTSGELVVWGRNDEGGLGLGNNLTQPNPTVNTGACSITYSNVMQAYVGSKSNETCPGDCNGSATISVANGIPPFAYQWNVQAGGQTTATATGLCAGTYQCYVSDSGGTMDTVTVSINSPSGMTINTSNTSHVICHGDSTGTTGLAISGGAPPYQVNWSTGDTTTQLANLPAGTYQAFITDSLGCADTAVVQITEPQPISAIFTTSPASADTCDGSIIVNASGGTAPYFFQWDSLAGNQTSDTATGLCPDNYCITITDLNGCEFDTCNIQVLLGKTRLDEHIEVYPNPTTAQVHIQIPSTEFANAFLYDQHGRMLKESELRGKGTIDLSDLAKGVYLLDIRIDSRTITRKVIKE